MHSNESACRKVEFLGWNKSAARRYKNYSEGIIKRLHKIPLHNGNSVKDNCNFDELPEGKVFRYLYRPL